MSHLINQRMLDGFLDKVSDAFPNADVTVIADRHGLPMASKIRAQQFQTSEEVLAASAVTDRKLLDLADYQKIVRPLSRDVNLMVLLKKSANNLVCFKKFNRILELENPI